MTTEQAWAKIRDLGPKMGTNPPDVPTKIQWIQALLTLGLRTLALHEIQQLATDVASHAHLVDLIAHADRLPEDLYSADEREQTILKNLFRLDLPSEHYESHLQLWRSAASQQVWFRCIDTNVVRIDQGRVEQLQDIQSAFRTMIDGALVEFVQRPRGPLVLDGISPPWILERLLEDDAQPTTLGFRQRLLVVHTQWDSFFDGLSTIDLGERLGDDRIQWFVGADAVDQLGAFVEEHNGNAHSSVVISNPANHSPQSPAIQVLFPRSTPKKPHTTKLCTASSPGDTHRVMTPTGVHDLVAISRACGC
ncbi:MAG: hypothetical protein JKY96_01675 [Phycisphaerales bacterium]|nr:hypothetical protein [Phycisphaerales bacterium]